LFINSLSLQGLQVLVVDDDLDSCKLLELVFQEYAMNVQTALSAQQALDVLTQFQPHILVIDIVLPGQDGYSLLHTIRQLELPTRAKALAIAVTADSTQSKQWAIEAGFDELLLKPLDISELMQVLADLVQQQNRTFCKCCV